MYRHAPVTVKLRDIAMSIPRRSFHGQCMLPPCLSVHAGIGTLWAITVVESVLKKYGIVVFLIVIVSVGHRPFCDSHHPQNRTALSTGQGMLPLPHSLQPTPTNPETRLHQRQQLLADLQRQVDRAMTRRDQRCNVYLFGDDLVQDRLLAEDIVDRFGKQVCLFLPTMRTTVMDRLSELQWQHPDVKIHAQCSCACQYNMEWYPVCICVQPKRSPTNVHSTGHASAIGFCRRGRSSFAV
jgi:hypothetical protein